MTPFHSRFDFTMQTNIHVAFKIANNLNDYFLEKKSVDIIVYTEVAMNGLKELCVINITKYIP